MKPYYQDKWVTIYHGDCRDILPELPKVDLVLTDPPYGIGEAAGKNASRGKIANVTQFDVDDWDDEPIDLELMISVTEKGKSAIIFGGNYYCLPPTSCWLVWDKENGTNDFADCELAWTNLKKAVRIFRFRWSGMLQGDMKNKDFRYHPTQKPISVMRWCITQADNPQAILDPFKGKG